MSLLLKWAPKQIALYRKSTQGDTAEDQLLGSLELDFELEPLSLTREQDRHRLLAAIAKLKEDAGIPDGQVDLVIPTSWGIAHRIPSPDLPDEEMQNYLEWELSKAAADEPEHYRFNFAFSEDDGAILTAIRIRLLDPINQVVKAAGFKLRGLFLDGDPWNRVNLATAAARKTIGTKTRPGIPVETTAGKPSRIPPRRGIRQTPSPRFFALVLLIGVILVAVFVWWKLTTREKPVQEKPVAVTETTPAESSQPVAEETGEPVEGGESTIYRTPMALRLVVLQQVLNALDEQGDFDHISFTENQFLCQITTADKSFLNRLNGELQGNPDVADVKLAVSTTADGAFRGVFNGVIRRRPGSTPVTIPDPSKLVESSGKYGLSNEGLVFTGSREAVLEFLDSLGKNNYSIYRLILLPWNDREFRIVLEL
jgi:hypothetical protein